MIYFIISLVVLIAACAADYITSLMAHETGKTEEKNPFGLYASTWGAAAVTAAVSCAFMIMMKLTGIAIALNYIVGAAHCWAAVHNYRLARQILNNK